MIAPDKILKGVKETLAGIYTYTMNEIRNPPNTYDPLDSTLSAQHPYQWREQISEKPHVPRQT